MPQDCEDIQDSLLADVLSSVLKEAVIETRIQKESSTIVDSMIRTETAKVCQNVYKSVLDEEAKDLAEIIAEEQTDRMTAETGIETLIQCFADQILEEDDCFSQEEREEALADMACMRVIKMLSNENSGLEIQKAVLAVNRRQIKGQRKKPKAVALNLYDPSQYDTFPTKQSPKATDKQIIEEFANHFIDV